MMRRITCVTDFALALFCMFLWVPVSAGQGAPAQARPQPGTIYICSTRTNNQPSVLYRSGVFHVAPNTSLGAINEAFQNYLRTNYHLQFSGSSCGDMIYDPEGQRYFQAEQGEKRKIVVVDWKYVPGQDTSPPPQAVAERTILYFCSSYFGPNSENLAFSDSFEAPAGTNINMVRDDFVTFVKANYSPHDANNGGCSQENNKAEVKEESATREHKKIIETGWKPKTFQKGIRIELHA